MERLDTLLVSRGLVSSRTRAARLIKDSAVEVRGVLVTDPSKKVAIDADIALLSEELPWVSRGALKLLAALDAWGIDPKDRVALDIGSSTGGFTEVLLSKGAKTVYAIDVGKEQLAERLRNDPRVIVRESTDIRDMTSRELPELPSLVVIDLSFISLGKIISRISELLLRDGEVIALVKPQFEVGKAKVGRGVVKNEKDRERALRDVSDAFTAAGFTVRRSMPSPIEGGEGNKEYLLYATLNSQHS